MNAREPGRAATPPKHSGLKQPCIFIRSQEHCYLRAIRFARRLRRRPSESRERLVGVATEAAGQWVAPDLEHQRTTEAAVQRGVQVGLDVEAAAADGLVPVELRQRACPTRARAACAVPAPRTLADDRAPCGSGPRRSRDRRRRRAGQRPARGRRAGRAAARCARPTATGRRRRPPRRRRAGLARAGPRAGAPRRRRPAGAGPGGCGRRSRPARPAGRGSPAPPRGSSHRLTYVRPRQCETPSP